MAPRSKADAELAKAVKAACEREWEAPGCRHPICRIRWRVEWSLLGTARLQWSIKRWRNGWKEGAGNDTRD